MRSLRTVLMPPELGRDFTRLWSASAVSNLGDGAMLAAGPLLVASITTSPAAVAAALFVQQLPSLLFALFSGALVDRLDRRRVIVAADLFRAVVLGVLTVTVTFDTSPLVLVYAVLFLLGSGETLADNAGGALLVNTVPAEHLGKANSRLFATFTVANQLAGPPIGAWLFAVGSAVPLGFDALSFLLAGVLVSRVAARPASRPDVKERLTSQVKEGMRWLWHHAGVRTLALAILVMNITFSAAYATWVLFARERLGLSEAQFGLLIAAGAVRWVGAGCTARRRDRSAVRSRRAVRRRLHRHDVGDHAYVASLPPRVRTPTSPAPSRVVPSVAAPRRLMSQYPMDRAVGVC